MTPLDVVKVRIQAQNSLQLAKSIPKSNAYVFCGRFYDRVEPCACRMKGIMGGGAAAALQLPTTDALSARPQIRGTLSGIVQITRTEGLTSLWRGLSPTLVMSVPATTVYFVSYETIKESIQQHPIFQRNVSNKNRDLLAPFLAGSMARSLAVALISPLELLKTRMQHRGKHDGGIVMVSRDIIHSVRQEGIHILYRGLVPTLWRDVPFSAIYWAAYEKFKKFYAHRIPASREHDPRREFLLSFASGATSGMLAAALTTPFDVAKTRKQVDSTAASRSICIDADKGNPLPRKGIAAHLVDIWRSEGAAGLTRGIVPRVFKVAPACAVMVGSYEFGKSYFAQKLNVNIE